MQMLGGYFLPLAGLYIWEMRDRWMFAKRRHLRVPGIKETMLRGVGPVATEMTMSLLVMNTLRLDY